MGASKEIPLVDLKAQYAAIKTEIDRAIQDTLDNTAFIMGERVRNFEVEFARFCGCPFAVGCSSGTTALHVALLACGVGAGDEVILPSHTFIATAEAVCHCGATPVLADIDPETYTIDPKHIERLLTPRTKAIVPVHIYGQCCDMDPILNLARARKIRVVEDCAQAHGAEYKGRRVGTLGDVGAFSFFPGKNLGAYGDAGAVTTHDKDLAGRMKALVDHGRASKYLHDIVGYNYRMDALQAAILSVKLRHLSDWTAARQGHAGFYTRGLTGSGVITPVERFGHVYHLYVIRSKNRDGLAQALKEQGIATGVHYPVPLHLQPCFKDLPGAGKGHLPVTEAVADEILSLPIYPELSEEQQSHVCNVVRDFAG